MMEPVYQVDEHKDPLAQEDALAEAFFEEEIAV